MGSFLSTFQHFELVVWICSLQPLRLHMDLPNQAAPTQMNSGPTQNQRGGHFLDFDFPIQLLLEHNAVCTFWVKIQERMGFEFGAVLH
ncbi:hypothetical protein ACFX1S_042103 [Malus domestica]